MYRSSWDADLRSSRIGVLLLCLLPIALTACVKEYEAPSLAIEVQNTDLAYRDDTQRRVLDFAFSLTNGTDVPQHLYVFVYAHNETSDPPVRSIYPPRALRDMGRDRRFGVANPRLGIELHAAPGRAYPLRGALLVPDHWHDGRPITADTFEEIALFVYDAAGRNVFTRTWGIAGE